MSGATGAALPAGAGATSVIVAIDLDGMPLDALEAHGSYWTASDNDPITARL